jgi:RNA polymerase sigma-70 factor, ECF subfamily
MTEEFGPPPRPRRMSQPLPAPSEPSDSMTNRDSDEALIALCRTGDRDALRALYERHGDRVYAIALSFFGDDASARDLTQDVFVKVMDRAHQFLGQSSFKTWLHRMVINGCLDERRRGARLEFRGETASLDTADESAAAPGDALIGAELTAQVQQALAGLPPNLRAAVLLRHFDELSYEEMAVALECAPGTVASRLHRAHAMLAERLAHLRPPRGA